MSCKYKNSGCSSLCDVIHGYCQFQSIDDICPIYYAYIDFDKSTPSGGDGEGDSEVVRYGAIVGADSSVVFKANNINLKIRKNN